jgi:hypothetical protein
LETYLVDSVLPFVEGASRKNSAYQHLEFAGCGAIGIGEVNAPLPFLRSYPGIWSTGFTEDEIIATGLKLTPEQHAQVFVSCLHDSSLLQVNAMTEDTIDSTVARLDLTEDQGAQLKQLHNSHLMQPNQVRDYLVNALPKMADYFEVWEGTAMKNMSLTSVGIAIAHANVKRITGEDSSLSLWM